MNISHEWELMLAGELYDPLDPMLTEARLRSQRLCQRYNSMDPGDVPGRLALLEDLFCSFGKKSEIVQPFYCDYGANIRMGSGSFMNFDCVILDCAWITIGDRVLMGPKVQLYGATHPLEASVRSAGRELGKPITVGDDVWIGGGAILCPGVTVGSGTTIGAGSVVTRSIPSNVFAAGNPCRVIREL